MGFLGKCRDDKQGKRDRSHIWELQVRLTEEEDKALEPAAPQMAFGGPTPPLGQAITTGTDREKVENLFGMQFPWVRGMLDFTSGKNKQTDIPYRIRYDGDFTYMMAAQSLKRPIFVELLEGYHINGGASFRLHTMQLDQTMMRERIASHVSASLGATVTQAAHAELSMVVGNKQSEFIELYTILEAVDESFLRQNDIPDSSLLIQTNGLNAIQYVGNDWTPYAQLFRTNRTPSKEQQVRIIAFARLISDATNEEFNAKIGEFIDLDVLLHYVAANTLTSNVTGMSNLGADDYLCLDAKGNFNVLACQMETARGGSILSGTPEQLTNVRVMRPYAGDAN